MCIRDRFEGGDCASVFQILLTGSRVLKIWFYFPIKSKNNHVKKTDHGLFKCSKFSSLTNFQSLNRHCSVLLNLIALQLDREGIKGRENGKRDGGEAITRGRRLF